MLLASTSSTLHSHFYTKLTVEMFHQTRISNGHNQWVENQSNNFQNIAFLSHPFKTIGGEVFQVKNELHSGQKSKNTVYFGLPHR